MARAQAPAVAADSAALAATGTAVLCEALVFLDSTRKPDRMLVAHSRRIADRLVRAAARALERSGRRIGPALHASSGILLEPGQEYQLAWERPSSERTGTVPLSRPPFHADPRISDGGSMLADWRALVKRVAEHDSTAPPEAVRIARGLHAGELLVIVVRGTRSSAKEYLEIAGNPLADMWDEERVRDARTVLDLALYRGADGRQLWTFPNAFTGTPTSTPEHLARWTEAALELVPSRGTLGGHDDVTVARFRPPYRNDMSVRLGRIGVRGIDAFLFGTRLTHLFRPWISAGFQLDWEALRPRHIWLSGSGTQAGAPFEYWRELRDVQIDVFPFYPVLEAHLTPFAGTLATAGVSGGYALAFIAAPDAETQILGSWGWAAHLDLRWRSPVSHAGFGIEGVYQRLRPGHDGTDPVTLAPSREHLDLDGWGLLFSLSLWQ